MPFTRWRELGKLLRTFLNLSGTAVGIAHRGLKVPVAEKT
jgi:hypothetical protein